MSEDRAAVGLLARFGGLCAAIWVGVTSFVHPDSWLVRAGLSEEVEFVMNRADRMDRAAKWGDKPVVWLIGSSIVRESFDEEDLRRRLQIGGVDVGVEKLAFGRGAPIFSWALLADLEVRPGDLVITTVATDNFRHDWLSFHGKPALYLQLLMRPSQIWQIRAVPWTDKVETSLASVPPRSYGRYGTAFANGIVSAATGDAEIRERGPLEPFSTRERWSGFRDLDNVEKNRMSDSDLDLSDSQPNVQGLKLLIADARARGADPWVVFVPPSPELRGRFLGEHVQGEFEAWMADNAPHWRELRELDQSWYMDYKHPNYMGRARLTRELAAWIVAGGDPARMDERALGPVSFEKP